MSDGIPLIEYRRDEERIMVRCHGGSVIDSFPLELFCTDSGTDSVGRRIGRLRESGLWTEKHDAQWGRVLFSALPLAYFDFEGKMVCARLPGRVGWDTQHERSLFNTVESANEILQHWQGKTWWTPAHSMALAKVLRDTRTEPDEPSFAVRLNAFHPIAALSARRTRRGKEQGK
jgi:hypothetical protein